MICENMKKWTKRVENQRKSLKIGQDRCGRGQGVQKLIWGKTKEKTKIAKIYEKLKNRDVILCSFLPSTVGGLRPPTKSRVRSPG